ncbi:hypothetical protein KSZ_22450 [Dictyobacter formicarum]|uniref:Uncharacterized protein n=1 Tax=Dictyobacter formicarum TaxID=2778368 RepID=A0ABQ3VDR2_9CHLR|nr:hypothetical protein KSZ_22450 [Dictyobacter formicarum]
MYPGENGPIDSIRLEVFYEALQDQRAFQLVETIIGKDQTIELLEKDIEKPITFNEYPRDLTWLLSMREKLNQCIQLNLHTK